SGVIVSDAEKMSFILTFPSRSTIIRTGDEGAAPRPPFSKGAEMRREISAALVALLLAVSLNALSQSTNATLGGTVQDSTGAFIPGVTVTATNTGTGIVITVISNESGAYQFASLQPGLYEFKAELPGFQSAVVKEFQLGGAQQARLNFTLQVAAAAATTID